MERPIRDSLFIGFPSDVDVQLSPPDPDDETGVSHNVQNHVYEALRPVGRSLDLDLEGQIEEDLRHRDEEHPDDEGSR